MTAFNKHLPVTCPYCGNVMELGNSDDTIDNGEDWDSGWWREIFICSKCKKDFGAEVTFTITVDNIEVIPYDDN